MAQRKAAAAKGRRSASKPWDAKGQQSVSERQSVSSKQSASGQQSASGRRSTGARPGTGGQSTGGQRAAKGRPSASKPWDAKGQQGASERQSVSGKQTVKERTNTDSHWREKSQILEANSSSPDTYKYKYATLQDLIKAAKGKSNALIVALDHITDVGNLGAILRSAEVVGATGALIPNRRSAQVNEAVYRTSAGAVEHLMVAREANLATSLERLKAEGFWIAGATEHASKDIWQAPLEGKLVVVMGAEDTGISRLVLELCDFEFKLPQRGVTSSLNVAQAFTAIAYEWLRRS